MRRLRLLLIFVLLLGALGIDAFLIEPNSLRIRYETITSPKIPLSMDNYTILIFSDLHYNNFTNKQRALKMVDMINSIDANTVIFLGDLYDHPTQNPVSDETQKELAEILTDIHAKYGKFAVLGNHDYESAAAAEMVTKTLNNANFEVYVNGNQNLYFGGEDYIKLIAIDSLALGDPDIPRAFKGVSEDDFNLVITHCPDIFDTIDSNLADLVLAGHSHGGQIRVPFLISIVTSYGADNYQYGIHFRNSSQLDITNGVGNTYINARFNSPAEVVVYRLVHSQ